MDILFTFGIMAFLGVMAVFSFGLPRESVAGDVLSASGFPLLLTGIGLALCLVQLIRQLKAKKEAGEKLIDLSTPAGRALAYTALVLAAYIAVMSVLGFILSTFLFTIVSAFVMGYRKKGKLLAFAVITTVALFLLFGRAFYVPLPRGVGLLKELSYLLY